jgi:hypothetical protein
MSDQRFADVVGAGKPIKWERPLFFFAALCVADLVWVELAPSINWSTTSGFSATLFNVSDPWGWLLNILANAILTVLAFGAFRLSPNPILALAIVVIAYPPVSFVMRTVIFMVAFGAGWHPRVWEITRSLVNSFAYVFFFIGCLVIALRFIKHVLAALLVGAVVGTLLGELVFLVTGLIFPREFGPPREPGAIMHEILTDLALMPFAALAAVLFALFLWLALRLTQTPTSPEPRLTKSLYAGTWTVATIVGAFLAANTMLLITLGTWKTTPAREIVPIFLLLGIVMVVALIGTVVFAVLIYKMWAAIQDGHARTTPGRALGFLFIPVFNIYWAFQALWGFAKDYNSFIERHTLNLRRLPEGLFLAYVVLCFTTWIPFLGWFLMAANIVVGALMIAKICDAVNALPGGDETLAVSQAVAALAARNSASADKTARTAGVAHR